MKSLTNHQWLTLTMTNLFIFQLFYMVLGIAQRSLWVIPKASRNVEHRCRRNAITTSETFRKASIIDVQNEENATWSREIAFFF